MSPRPCRSDFRDAPALICSKQWHRLSYADPPGSKYYFPFGNMDWIWAQRGRHWSREGNVSMAEDRGRGPFEAEDAMENCK